jgi:hypothetical protein
LEKIQGWRRARLLFALDDRRRTGRLDIIGVQLTGPGVFQ